MRSPIRWAKLSGSERHKITRAITLGWEPSARRYLDFLSAQKRAAGMDREGRGGQATARGVGYAL